MARCDCNPIPPYISLVTLNGNIRTCHIMDLRYLGNIYGKNDQKHTEQLACEINEWPGSSSHDPSCIMHVFSIFYLYFPWTFQKSLLFFLLLRGFGWLMLSVYQYPSGMMIQWGRDNVAAISQTTFSNAFFNENIWISLKILLKFARINNISALVQIMAWCRSIDKLLLSPMMNDCQFIDSCMRHSASMGQLELG